jgi:cyclase
MKQVTKNVFVETDFGGCNPGFIKTTEGLVLIDSPHRPTDGMDYRRELEKYGEAKYLINTEPHGDHISSNFLFNVVFVAQEGTRERMANEVYLKRVKQQLSIVDPDFSHNLKDYRVPLARITFSDTMTLYIGKHTIRLLHLPGHTASETAVFIPEENAVFTGDNIFHNTNTFMHEALPSKWLASLEKLKALDTKYYIPGHGDVCGKDYLDEQMSAVKEWIETIQEALGKGWSLEETQERISFLDRYSMEEEMKIRAKELEKLGIANVYNLAQQGQI